MCLRLKPLEDPVNRTASRFRNEQQPPNFFHKLPRTRHAQRCRNLVCTIDCYQEVEAVSPQSRLTFSRIVARGMPLPTRWIEYQSSKPIVAGSIPTGGPPHLKPLLEGLCGLFSDFHDSPHFGSERPILELFSRAFVSVT